MIAGRARTRSPLLLFAAATALTLVGCTATGSAPSGGEPGGESVLSASAVEAYAEAQSQHPTPVAATRLAEGLAAPTSSWFSGLVFGDEPMPVFPHPLSFVVSESGYGFGVPEVTTTADLVLGASAPVVQVALDGDEQIVSRYDDVSVTMDRLDGSELVGRTTIARGSPVVAFTAAGERELRFEAVFRDAGTGVSTVEIGGRVYALAAPEGTLGADGLSLTLPDGATASWLAGPDGADTAEVAALAAELDPIESVSTSYSAGLDGSDPVTRLDYTAAGAGTALIGVLPHQAAGGAAEGCDLGGYSTVYGAMTLCDAESIEWSSPAVEPAAAIAGLGSLDGDARDEILTQLGDDLTSADALAADTYFGGKHLARLANLLQLARELAVDDPRAEPLAADAFERLSAELRTWSEPEGCDSREERCFAYDPTQPGVVGFASSFGAEEYNDHHFHYGYFLYAAGVATGAGAGTGTGPAGQIAGGSTDQRAELRDDITPVMTLLAADLASGETSQLFPARRAFDPYSGHSWASGFAPFGDGNNQESSSEAVAAWNGLALWAESASDDALERESRWMLAAEAASARAYWTDFDRADPAYADYAHGVVGIVWDGKRDYATWFSPEPGAILGIQLIPMTGVSEYLGGDPERVRANIAEVTDVGPPAQFADLLLMYAGLAGPEDAEAALAEARELPERAIDDGNSRSMMLAWLHAHAAS